MNPGELDWNKIKARVRAQEPQDVEPGIAKKSLFVGTVFALTPSGKYYMPWCTNVTTEEAEEDSVWWEAMEHYAEEHGLVVECGEGCPTDIFISSYEEVDDVSAN